MGRKIQHAYGPRGGLSLRTGHALSGDTRPVIEAGPLQVAIRETKTERSTSAAGCGGRAGPRNVPVFEGFQVDRAHRLKAVVFGKPTPAVVAAAVESCMLFAVAGVWRDIPADPVSVTRQAGLPHSPRPASGNTS